MNFRYFIIVIILFLLDYCSGDDDYHNIQRLPGDLKPNLYTIRIFPYFDAPGIIIDPEKKDQTFDADVTIYTHVMKPTSTIILNAKNLTFPLSDEFTIVYSLTHMKPIKTVQFFVTPENETITIELERELRYNEYFWIKLKYNGEIGLNTYKGFFKSVAHNSPTGEEKIVYVTKFETTGARAVFPCFDEPAYKAKFEVTIVKPKAWIALSNTLNTSILDIGNGYEEINFAKTEPISTYLVAFAIGDLVNIEGYTADGILTRIWKHREEKRNMTTALKSAIKCTETLTNYTNFRLPLKKIDHLAIPYGYGGMENFGLITYGDESALLDFDTLSSWFDTTNMICHELSHHWFGDIVTTEWWGDIFLNEGFARFFQSKAITLAYPKEKAFIDFKVAKSNRFVFIFNNYHPIITKNGYFDYITYCMGEAVLRQLEAVISPEIFQKALQNYIQKYQYSNANHQQLLDEIQESVDESDLKDWCEEAFNVTTFMDLWLNQKGHPNLSVDSLNGTFTITQNIQNGTDEKFWPLPVFVQLENNQKRIYWSAPNYACKNAKILPKILHIKTPAIFVNRDILAVTEVHYSSNAIEFIVDALTSFTSSKLQLSPASLYAFIEDVFSSAQKNGTPKEHLKNMLENIFFHQSSAFTLGIFNEFTTIIEGWLEEGRFENAIGTTNS